MRTQKDIRKALKRLQYKKFPGPNHQRFVEEVLSNDNDVMLVMEPGRDRSMCYQLLGLLNHSKMTIVAEPQLTSIKTKVNYLRNLGINAQNLDYSLSPKDRRKLLDTLKYSDIIFQFLFVTPERVKDFEFHLILDQLIKEEKIGYFVVDEAHSIPRWCLFRPSFLDIRQWRQNYRSIKWLLISSPAPKEELDFMATQLKLYKPITVYQKPSYRENVIFHPIFASEDSIRFKHMIDSVKNFLRESPKSCGIIYCRSRDDVDKMSTDIRKMGIDALSYHSQLRDSEKEYTINRWLSGQLRVICATDPSFCMGIEMPTLNFIIYWTIPNSASAFYQDSLCLGTQGQRSYCLIYHSGYIRYLMNSDYDKEDAKGKEWDQRRVDKFNAFANFFKKSACFHDLFDKTFGAPTLRCKGQCHFCKKK